MLFKVGLALGLTQDRVCTEEERLKNGSGVAQDCHNSSLMRGVLNFLHLQGIV